MDDHEVLVPSLFLLEVRAVGSEQQAFQLFTDPP